MMLPARQSLAVLILVMAAMTSSACGVRQFNSKLPATNEAKGRLTAGFGPFYASGQGGGAMSVGDPSTGCNPAAHHPCARARASIGMPYQYDVNKNDTQGAITAGNVFPAAGPYVPAPSGGAGKTSVAAGPHAPEFPRMENRDLHILKAQTAPGEEVF